MDDLENVPRPDFRPLATRLGIFSRPLGEESMNYRPESALIAARTDHQETK